MKNILPFIVFTFVTQISFTQQKVFEKSVDDDLFTSDKGPNKKSFKHFYIQYSAFPIDYSGAQIKFLSSNSFGIGYRYKYKLAKSYSLGVEINYLRNNYNLKQNGQKRVPNSFTHTKENLKTNNLSIEAYQRINIGKTGNMLGLYFDLGGYVGYIFSPSHIYKDDVDVNEYNSEIRITKFRNLNYVESISYGLRSRVGYNKLGLIVDYRLSNLLKNSFKYPKLPDWSVGLQLSVF